MGGLTVSIQSEIKWLSFNGDLRPYEHCESSYTELYLLPFWLSLTNTVSEANPNNKLMMRRVDLSGSPAWFALLHQAQNILMFSKSISWPKGAAGVGIAERGSENLRPSLTSRSVRAAQCIPAASLKWQTEKTQRKSLLVWDLPGCGWWWWQYMKYKH